MSNTESSSFNGLKLLIDGFCEFVLTSGDKYDDEKAKQYISELSNDDKRKLNVDLTDLETKEQFELILQNNVIRYIKSCEKPSDLKRPFEFDTLGNHRKFLKICKEHYRDCNQGAPLPSTIECTVEYIHNSAEHYKIFSEFYDARSKETASKIINDITDVAEQKSKEAVKTATEEQAKEIVNKKVEEKMLEISKEISSSSVTILGLFSAIVLTIVAGLIYSSSVMDNISSANFFRLISVTSLVGIVCFDLLALMFAFIEKISKQAKGLNISYDFIKWINIFLIIVMLVGGILQFVFPSQENTNALDATNVTGQISVNIVGNSNNIDKNKLDETITTTTNETPEAQATNNSETK